MAGQCAMGIANGYLTSTCSRFIGESCSFDCELGYKAVSNISTVTCQQNLEWTPEHPCEDVLCPITINNGHVNEAECSRRIYSECPYACNQGFDSNPKLNRVMCQVNGIWSNDDQPYCLERKGLCINVFERGKFADDCHFNADETCAFECDRGFDKNLSITTNVTCTTSAQWDIDLHLLCIEHDSGLIFTADTDYSAKSIYTVPITLEGIPRLDYIRSIRFPTKALLLSVDRDYQLNEAYFYDAYSNTIYKNANFSISLSGNNVWTPVYMGTSNDNVKLAVDWISHNIYWTDPQYKWIMVQSLIGNSTSMYHVLIHEHLEGPHALALDPIECLLFWSDIGTFTKIEVSSLSGRNRKSLISSSLMHPYSMAADYATRRLYFIDSGRQTVETVTYEGRDRNVLFKRRYSKLFDIAVYKDYLYVTETHNNRLYVFNKTNVNDSYKRLSDHYAPYAGVTVFNPDAQPTPGTVNSEHFQRGLLYSNESSICIVDIRIFTGFIFNPSCVLKINGASYMVIDTDQRHIFIANNTAIFSAKVDNPVLQRLTKQSGKISGMAWDGYDRNLYWTEEDTGIIWRISDISKTAQIFMKDLKRPRDVQILLHERLILWISDRNGSTLESSKMDGSNHQVVLNSVDLTNPRSISYDPYGNRIYFLDASQPDMNYVVSCDTDGSNLYRFLTTSTLFEKLEIYKGHLLVTTNGVNGTVLTSFTIDRAKISASGVNLGVGNISTIKVFDENLRQNETGPCFTLNGECDQICIANGKWRICECTFGFKLAENGKTCISDPVKDNFILIPDTTHNAIYQMSLTNQSIQGISSEQTSSVTGVTYSPVHDLVIWGTYDHQLSTMHLNGTGKKLFPVPATSDDSYMYAFRFAVDYSTGNMYYTSVDYNHVYDGNYSTINVMSPAGKERVLVKGLDYPLGLVVYPSKGRMFYTDRGSFPHIGQAVMDGSQPTVLLDLTGEWPTELVIDYRTDKLYWIDFWDDSIRVCNLDGTNYQKLTEFSGSRSLSGLALYADYIFISTLDHSHLIKLKISNPNETTVIATSGELGTINSINLYSSTIHNRNELCSSDNGGCSTFCFPTPDGSVCGCEDGVDLKNGNNKECSNMHVCNDTIPNGSLPNTCGPDIGATCSYYCDDFFHKNPNISNIQCLENGQWDADLKVLCTKATPTCPHTFPGGGWDNCQYSANETCTYTCFPGYHKNPKIKNATCGVDGAWNQNIEKLCRRKCDLDFNNVSIESSCTLEIGDVCHFECEYGYKVASGVSTVTCQENGAWAPKEPCEEILCPYTIRNGKVDETMCDRRIYSECSFECNQGFDINPEHNVAFCDMDGTWEEDEKPYCLERQGLCINFFENGKWKDNCKFNADDTCAFECNPGFNRNPNISRNITCTSSAEWNIDLRLLCIENDRGLIITSVTKNNKEHISTIAIDSEGTPTLDYMPSVSFPIDVQPYSIEGDYTLQQAYMYDRYTKSIYKYTNFSIGLSRENKWTILHRGLSNAYIKLAVDWVSHNIYWTDPQYKWIVVQSLLGNDTSMYRVLIHDNLDGPHALALDPLEALLFWSDIGQFTKIEVSKLSGKNRKSLVYSNLLLPYSIAADIASRKLYFVDAGRKTLESVSYEGTDRKVLLKNTNSFFIDIAVFKEYVYVTDLVYGKLYVFNKTNGNEIHKSLTKDGVTYVGITVFHPDAQNTSVKAHCVSYGCEHICVTDIDSATCLCKDGYTLNQDMKTCSLKSEFFHRGLMFSNESSICIVDIRIVTHFSFNPNCVLKTNNTKYMVLDTDDRQIFLANRTAIYFASVDDPQLHLLAELSGTISGLAWDGYDRLLYWTEINTGRIWRMSMESEPAQVFLQGLKSPRDILILPHERLVYWISDRNGSTIESSSMDRSNHQIVLNSNGSKISQIYILSNSTVGRDYVRSFRLNGSDLVNFGTTNKTLEKLEIYKGHLLVTAKDDQDTLVMSHSIDLKTHSTSGIFVNTGRITAIKVFDESFRQNETGPCFELNGDCEQICISKGKSRICECTFGFKLLADGKTCTSDPINDNFMLVRDSTHNYIYQINLTDQSVQGIKAHETFSETGLAYSPVSGHVIWGTDESEISMMYLNGTGKKLYPLPTSNNNHVYPNRFAVDHSTGNIYYTAVSRWNYITNDSYIGVISPDGKHRVLVTRLGAPHGLVVYPSKGLLFYTGNLFDSHVGQANMDGSQSIVLLHLEDVWPTDLTVDYKSDYLYWINSWVGGIDYCKLDGTNHNTLITYPDAYIQGIAFHQDYLFLYNGGHWNIIQLKISNPNDTVSFASTGEMGAIDFITIYSSTIQNRNNFCSANNGGCSTFCFPVPGGGICGCEDGVYLKEGSKTVCSNKNERGLILTSITRSNNKHISTIAIDSDGIPNLDYMPSFSLPIDAQPYSIAGDYTLQHAYMYDRYSKSIYKDLNFTIGLSGENKWAILHRGLSKAYVKLAVDWISHNIYWTDPQYKWIVVQSLLGNDASMYRVLIHDNLDGPHALALDPVEALLFWSDIGQFTKIEVSNLSGKNRKSLVYSNLLRPYSIAADFASRQLYFVDAGRYSLETVSYEGMDRKVLLKKTNSFFSDVAVFKEYLYVIDSVYDQVYFFNKTNGNEIQKSLSKDGVTYVGVTVFHPDTQNTSVKAHCLSYGCEHICVTEIDSAACLCKDGYTLNKDNKTCSLNSEFFHRGLIFSNTSSICVVDIRVVTHFSYNPNCVLKVDNTKFMVLDTDDRQIFLANNTFIYSARVDDPHLHQLAELSGTISGLAWDGYDRLLYWTETNTGRIWRMSMESEPAQVFLQGLRNPRDILILTHERMVYWISNKNGSTIESASIDRRDHQIVLNSADVLDPRSLSYDPQSKRIYFLSNSSVGRNYIRSLRLDGSDLVNFVSTDKTLEKLEIYKGHLLVTAKDDKETLIMSFSIDLGRLTTSGIFVDTGYVTAIKVFDENVRQNETGPCFVFNGDCEQICISRGISRICECTFGFKLSADGKTCASDPIHDNFMLVSDSTHNYIYQLNLTDQSVQGIKAQGTFPETGIAYNPVNDQVIWGTDESEISMMFLNGTGKKLSPLQNNNVYPTRFAVDYSTGNIYYTAFNGRYYVTNESYIGVISPDGMHRVLITRLRDPRGLVVYPSKGLLFYTDNGFNSHLGQANMDGSQSAVLINMEDEWTTDLTVDYKSDYLYWITIWEGGIDYCKLDGTNHNTLITYQDTIIQGLALYQEYLFFYNGDISNIIKLNISNPNETAAFSSRGELGKIDSIAIYSSMIQNRNKFCSVNNGGCSTFCFPIPGGGICGCEDGVDLKEGSKTVCSNTVTCPKEFNQGIIENMCERRIGQLCDYECTGYGYRKNETISRIECMESGSWNIDTNSLCQRDNVYSSCPYIGVILRLSHATAMNTI
ncbi:hypothetical protein ACJMK2_003269 [Sinanodonta woodiana]|uniref:Uncharacterized protein n=1 Tax=Sinanodonta woodiana TaxID=1069815 RepID=A0ABD3XXR1_SINWO